MRSASCRCSRWPRRSAASGSVHRGDHRPLDACQQSKNTRLRSLVLTTLHTGLRKASCCGCGGSRSISPAGSSHWAGRHARWIDREAADHPGARWRPYHADLRPPGPGSPDRRHGDPGGPGRRAAGGNQHNVSTWRSGDATDVGEARVTVRECTGSNLERRRSQVVRQRTANPLFGGSNPPGASSSRLLSESLDIAVWRRRGE
jgi:hypothetical protein